MSKNNNNDDDYDFAWGGYLGKIKDIPISAIEDKFSSAVDDLIKKNEAVTVDITNFEIVDKGNLNKVIELKITLSSRRDLKHLRTFFSKKSEDKL